VKRTRTQFRRRAFSVAGPDIWNSLPPEIRLTKNFATFERDKKLIYLTWIFLNLAFISFRPIYFLGCIECVSCRLLLPMCAVSVRQSFCHGGPTSLALLCGVIRCSLCQITLASCIIFISILNFNFTHLRTIIVHACFNVFCTLGSIAVTMMMTMIIQYWSKQVAKIIWQRLHRTLFTAQGWMLMGTHI